MTTIERVEKIEERGGIAYMTLSGGLLYVTWPGMVEGFAQVGRWELAPGDVVDVTVNKSNGIVEKINHVVLNGDDMMVRYISAAIRRN